jgi:multidrug resistance efflux pump
MQPRDSDRTVSLHEGLYMGTPWTRDATVRAYVAIIAPEVAGRIVELPVVDNKYVRKGDVLMVIDPTNYRIAVDQAEAAVQQAQASVQGIDAQMTVQQAQISANQAQLDVAQAALVFAQPATSHSEECTGKPRACTAAGRIAEGAAYERRGNPRASQGPTQPGAGES